MYVSVLLSSFSSDFASAARQAARLGFERVDVTAVSDRPLEDLEALAETGLLVSCAALGRDLPAGHAVDAPAVATRREVLEILKRQVADAARLGATHAYLIPGTDPSREGLARFGEVCRLLADFASQRMVKVCVEPIPGRALPTATGTMAWLRDLGHPNLALLLDVGHCFISGENPARVIDQAGPLLGYVHLDDNDGVQDLHWPLLTGRLTEALLRETVVSLHRIGYTGALSLEIANAEYAVIEECKNLVGRLLAPCGGSR